MRPRHTLLVLLSAAVLAFGGCQAMFTYSPLSGLQRPPSSMTPAQRLTYAQDALASGDTAAMKSAYDAIKNDTSAGAQYTAAQLGIELSGVPTLLVKVASDPSTVTAQLNTINTFITDNNLDPNFMVAAAAQLSAAKAAGAVLSDMDCAMGAMGIILGETTGPVNGNWTLTGLGLGGPGKPPVLFLQPAVADVASLPSGDPLKDFINQLNGYISNAGL
jgi:hypothetical protein